MTSYFPERIKSPSYVPSPLGSPLPSIGLATPGSVTTPGFGSKTNPLQARIASVLSASYSDLDLRDVLGDLDGRKIRNTPETRRNLRLEVQQELIQCNGEVVKDFGEVAEVSSLTSTRHYKLLT